VSGKAYVAGRFGDWREVRRVQAVLRERGYDITYDWTVHAEAGENERNGSMTVTAMASAAATDLHAAIGADLLVLVCVGDMADALGCYIEFGAAAAGGARIHVIAPARPSVFWHLSRVETFCSVEAWMAVFGLRSAA
jgi:hypothetical protein